MIKNLRFVNRSILVIVQFIKDNGKMKVEKGMEFQFGKMEIDTKDNGLMINSMVKESFILQKMKYTMENLLMGNLMEKVNIKAKMVKYLKDLLKMVSNKE